MKKLLSIVLALSIFVSVPLYNNSVQAVADGKIVYTTGFEFGNTLFNDTIFWTAANVDGTKSGYTSTAGDAINGSRSYKFVCLFENS